MTKAKASAPKKSSNSSSKKRIILTLSAEHGAEVYVAGTFNGWDPSQKQMIDKTGSGNYSCALMLPPGTYEYKFKVNNAWVLDQNNPHFTQNNLGTLNSVLDVQ